MGLTGSDGPDHSPDHSHGPDADVTWPGHPHSSGREAPSSGSFGSDTSDTEDTGTAAGDPLAGTGTPQEPPVYPEGSDISMNDA